jgi:hypothetical protein
MNLNVHTLTKERKWREWLHELVFFENRTVERYKAYRVFALTALIPFVKKNGYSWISEKDIPNHLANLIYYKNEWLYQEDNRPDYYDYFTIRRISQDKWDSFWSYWGYFVDFAGENENNRYAILPFVWNRLNLIDSHATDDLEWEMDEDRPMDEVSNVDSYGTYIKDKHSLY